MDRMQQIEIGMAKAEKKYKELQSEMSSLGMEIHILQLNLNTLKNTLKEN